MRLIQEIVADGQQPSLFAKSAIEYAPVPTFICNPLWQIIAVNSAFTAITQYRADEVLGLSLSEIITGLEIHSLSFPRNSQSQDKLSSEVLPWSSEKLTDLWLTPKFGEKLAVELIGAFHEESQQACFFVGSICVLDTSHHLGNDERSQIEQLRTEHEKLRRRSQMFEIILEQMQEAVTVVDPQGQGLVSNHKAIEIAGNFPKNIHPQEWFNYIDLFAADGVTPMHLLETPIFKALLGETNSNAEAWLWRKADQRKLFLRGSAVPLKTGTGEVLGAICVFRDATAERQQQELLKASEERFRNLADSTPLLIWMINPACEASYFNRTWLQFTGHSLAQELGNGWQKGLHPDDLMQRQQMVFSAIQNKEPWEIEYRLLRYDGEYRWMVDHGVPVYSDAGEFQGYIGTCLDVTESKVAETRLQEEQARFDLVVRGAAVGIWDWVAATNRNYFSQRFCEILGFHPEEIEHTHNTFIELLHPEDRDRVREAALAHVEQRIPFDMEFRMRTKSGDYKWVHSSGQAVWDDQGRPVRMAGTVADITHRKLIEEALLESNALLEQKVTERTMELKQANALLHQEMLQRSQIEQERLQLQRDLAMAEEQQRRHIARELHDELGQLIVSMKLGLRNCGIVCPPATPLSERLHKLQEIADSIEKATHQVARKLRPTALDDQGLLPALIDLLEDWSRQSYIEVDWQAAEFKDHEFTLAVKSAIYRTVQEALTNVLKHARATRVSVILDRKPSYVLLIVEDNGQGFAVEAIDAPSNQRMGLKGMKERVELAGGEWEIESSPEGGGATIYVRLPLEQSLTTKEEQP
jgi:PAS domain S-box-containing protein